MTDAALSLGKARASGPLLRSLVGWPYGSSPSSFAISFPGRRLAEIEEDREEARGFGDDERIAKATLERDLLIQELSRAVGLGGHDRRAGAASERARASVTRAIRYGLDRVWELHPTLGAHLDHAVRTGTYAAYNPILACPSAGSCDRTVPGT